MADGEDRPVTADVKGMQQQSQYMVARVMSATDRRVASLQAGDSRASSASGSRLSAEERAAVASEEYGWVKAEHYVELVMATWKLLPNWKHCLKRIRTEDTAYIVEALYSRPTRRRPIPNATASVFFRVDPGEMGFPRPATPKDPDEVIEEDESEPKSVSFDPATATLPMQDQAKNMVANILDSSDRLIAAIIEDPSRPGSSLAAQLAGIDITYTLEQQRLIHNPDTQFKEVWLDNLLDAKRLMFGVSYSVIGEEPEAKGGLIPVPPVV